MAAEETVFQDFVCASQEEMCTLGWDKPLHRVTTCKYCSGVCATEPGSHIIKRAFGWIVIKKDTENGRLFCRCETCGQVWLDIADALRAKNADAIQIHSYSDASDEDIHTAGWDTYDNVIHLDDRRES